MSKLSAILARKGVVVTPASAPSVTPTKQSSARSVFSARPSWMPSTSPVGTSSDLDRILGLPSRPAFDEHHDYSALVDRLTAEFQRPAGTMRLHPVQAFALEEARTVGGLAALLGVGSGKTLLGLLLPVALGVSRTVLLLPSQLKAQLLNDAVPTLGKHWRIANVKGADVAYPDIASTVYPVSYEELSNLRSADVLERYQPELVVADESHYLRRLQSARTTRFLHHVIAAMRVGTLKHLALMTGTPVSRSIRDLHFLRYALGRYAPLPWDEGTLAQWADALDPSDHPTPPGALTALRRVPGESVRVAFSRRLLETPGVVATTESPVPVRNVFRERPVEVPESVRKVLHDLRKSWRTPWGEEIEEALAFSRYARQLAAGLMYRRVWPRNEPQEVREEWLEARAEWHREVRSFLATRATKGMDSYLALCNAAADGRRPSKCWDRWSEIRDAAKPDVEPVWIDDFVVKDAIDWGRNHHGVIWYEHTALGERIAAEGGFRLIAGGDAGDAVVSDLARRAREGERSHPTVVASRPARGRGTDGLQLFFREQLVTTPSSNGERWEQLLGRLHRIGQDSDTVTTWVYRHSDELVSALENAVRLAQFAEETTNNEQKLCRAEFRF